MEATAAARVSPGARLIIIALALALVFFAGALLLVGPKRSEAAALDREIEATRAVLEVTAGQPRVVAQNRRNAAEQLARLEVAAPERVEMSKVLVELNGVAERALVRIDDVTPAPPIPKTGYQVQPLDVTLQGTFFAVSDFIRLLRAEATLRNGVVGGSGRVYTVDSVVFTESTQEYPILTTAIRISTVFGAVAVAAATPEDAAVEPTAATGGS